MENPIKMDDLGYPYFWKHPYRMVSSNPNTDSRREPRDVFFFVLAMMTIRGIDENDDCHYCCHYSIVIVIIITVSLFMTMMMIWRR